MSLIHIVLFCYLFLFVYILLLCFNVLTIAKKNNPLNVLAIQTHLLFEMHIIGISSLKPQYHSEMNCSSEKKCTERLLQRKFLQNFLTKHNTCIDQFIWGK